MSCDRRAIHKKVPHYMKDYLSLKETIYSYVLSRNSILFSLKSTSAFSHAVTGGLHPSVQDY